MFLINVFETKIIHYECELILLPSPLPPRLSSTSPVFVIARPGIVDIVAINFSAVLVVVGLFFAYIPRDISYPRLSM